MALTHAQQAAVDKITRSPETVNVGVIRKTDIKESGPPENRYARLVLPLSDGKEITLIRTRNTVETERGFTWRGVAEETGERAIIMLWNDGHLSGYFAYSGRVFSVNHMGGDIHIVAELELPSDHATGPEWLSVITVSTGGRAFGHLDASHRAQPLVRSEASKGVERTRPSDGDLITIGDHY